jgi:D-inositol-3-phosphate glycosyltransferase
MSAHRPSVALVSWHTSPFARPGAGTAGGMNVYVREVAAALARSGLRVDVLTSSPKLRHPAIAALGERLRLVSLPADARLDGDDLGLPHYRVVHSHYWQSAAPARAATQRSGARHIHTFHTLGHVKNLTLGPGDVPEPDRRLLAERQVVSCADGVVVSTADEKAQLVELVGARADRIRVIPPGVDRRLFRPQAAGTTRSALGLSDRLVVLYTGRIQPLKGIGLAVDALGRLAPELPRRCTFVIAGGPSGQHGHVALAELRRAARRLPAAVDVRVLGRWPHRRLPSLMGAANVAVVCSRSESFCLSALEAQACGVPVVGTAVGGLPSFIADGESGYLVERTPEAFAARLADVLVSTRRQRAMRAGAVESARRFSWTATAASIREVYEL